MIVSKCRTEALISNSDRTDSKEDIEKSSTSLSAKIKSKEKRRRGRPKGSKNKNKTEVNSRAELLQIQKMIQELFKLISGLLPLTYLVLDGHFGNKNALQMARQVNLQIISKLRRDAALYIPYQNPDPIIVLVVNTERS